MWRMISPAANLLRSLMMYAATLPLCPVDLCARCLVSDEVPRAIEALDGSAEQARAPTEPFWSDWQQVMTATQRIRRYLG